MADAVGAMRERLVVLQNVWPALTLVSLSRSGTTATAVTQSAHSYVTGDYVTIADAAPAGYNGKVKITVVDALTFTYTVASGLTTPATQAITTTYVSDAQGGRRANWTTLATVWAEMMPQGGRELLQAAAVQAISPFQFRIRARVDLSVKMRVQWTPRWPPLAPAETYELTALGPYSDPYASGIRYQILSCVQVAS